MLVNSTETYVTTDWKALNKKSTENLKAESEVGSSGIGNFQDTLTLSTVERESNCGVYGVPLPSHIVPYEELVNKDGVISYNGVTFTPDYNTHSICLGDMSKEENIITIPLTGGGNLKVNRNNLDSLAKAIGMFSPEDVKKIMHAITIDAKAQKVKTEVEQKETEVFEQLFEKQQEE